MMGEESALLSLEMRALIETTGSHSDLGQRRSLTLAAVRVVVKLAE